MAYGGVFLITKYGKVITEIGESGNITSDAQETNHNSRRHFQNCFEDCTYISGKLGRAEAQDIVVGGGYGRTALPSTTCLRTFTAYIIVWLIHVPSDCLMRHYLATEILSRVKFLTVKPYMAFKAYKKSDPTTADKGIGGRNMKLPLRPYQLLSALQQSIDIVRITVVCLIPPENII